MATRASGPTRMSLRPFRAKDYKRIFADNDVISGGEYLREDSLEDGAVFEVERLIERRTIKVDNISFNSVILNSSSRERSII